MSRDEFIGKLNALYVGDKNCLEELLTTYDEKDKEIERLENIIKEVREWLNKTIFYFDFEKEVTSHTFELLYTAQGQELLSILDKENK